MSDFVEIFLGSVSSSLFVYYTLSAPSDAIDAWFRDVIENRGLFCL